MGSGTSRGKKVAPARVSQADEAAASPPRRSGPLDAPPGCHSEGHDSEVSAEDDDGEPQRGRRAGVRAQSPPPPKKPCVKSRTYRLCHFSRDDAEDDEEPRGSRDVNKRSGACTRSRKHARAHDSCALEAAPAADEPPTSGHSSPLTMPVILYDGSDEELMDTIEREFS